MGAMMGHQKITVNRPSSTVPRRNCVISLQIPCLIILNEAYDHHSEQNSTASPFVAFSSNISACFCDKCQIGRGIRLIPSIKFVPLDTFYPMRLFLSIISTVEYL